jgi:hypothetical protein
MSHDMVQRCIDAGSKHSREDLEAAWKRMQDGAKAYLRRELKMDGSVALSSITKQREEPTHASK